MLVEEAKCLVSFVYYGSEYGAFSGAALADDVGVRARRRRGAELGLSRARGLSAY